MSDYVSGYLRQPPRPLAEVAARKTCGQCERKGSGPIAVCAWHDIAVAWNRPADDCPEFERELADDEAHGDNGAAR